MKKISMNTVNRKGTALYVAASLSFLLLAACQQPSEIEKLSGGEISFDATAAYQADVKTRSAEDEIQTRTVYSGKDETDTDVNSTSLTERIDWLNTDCITILCQQSEGNKTANFSITPGTYSGAVANAKIDEIDHKLYWGTAGTTHHFFGLYPSPLQSTDTEVASIVSANSGTAATISGLIPATQTVTVSGTELKPNMDYAYMYAATTASTGTVKLDFKPLVTTLRFTLRSETSFPSGLKLTQLQLKSTQTDSYLTGNFTATITDAGLTPLTRSNVTNGGNTITITVPNGGISLSSSDVLMFTILTLPMDQTAMKLTLTFSDGSSKTLSLKSNGSDITVHACKKCYINDANLPWVYELTASPNLTFPFTGGPAKNFTVTSYKHISSDGTSKVPVSWTAVAFSSDNGNTWVETVPGAFLDLTTSGPGSGSGDPCTAQIGHSPRTSTPNNQLLAAPERGSQASPYDLSTHNITGGGISKTTANCYVVSAAGWYKFPLAYGNGWKNGQKNTKAYNTGNTSGFALKNLVKHDGTAITDPDISGVSRVELLWQDAEDLITVSDLSIKNGYVVFHIEHDNIGEGNAVIAAKNSSGTILWSWHIWVTPFTGNVTMRGQTYEARNLGWCDGGTISYPARKFKVRFQQAESNKTVELTYTQTDGGSKTVLGSGPHYQWGRKDPMIPPSGETGTDIDDTYRANKLWYNAAGQVSQQVPIEQGPKTIQYAITHPMHMIWLKNLALPGYISSGNPAYEYGTYDGRGWAFADWIGTTNLYYGTGHYTNLWNSNVNVNPNVNDMITVKVYENTTHAKTVYDPCPIGYTIPLPTELSNLAKSDKMMGGYPQYSGSQDIQWDDDVHGLVCGGNILPANGMRFYSASSTNVGNVGKYGYYFSSTYCNAHNGLCLIFGFADDYRTPYMTSGFPKGSGRSIRCVPDHSPNP